MNNLKYAFFDVDETLIQCKSMLDFLNYYSLSEKKKITHIKIFFKYAGKLGISRYFLNKTFYKVFKNTNYNKLMYVGRKWFSTKLNNSHDFFERKTLNHLLYLQRNNTEIVLVSGSFRPCLQPLADYLGIKHIICTELALDGHTVTGALTSGPVIAEGKRKGILQFMHTKKITNLKHCYAYADDTSDIPMLELVGNPFVIAGNPGLERYAHRHSWNII